MGEEPAPTGKAIHSLLLEPTDLRPVDIAFVIKESAVIC